MLRILSGLDKVTVVFEKINLILIFERNFEH